MNEHELIAVLGKALFLASLSSPIAERMSKPRPGDLVVETSSLRRAWDPDQIGRLIRIEGDHPDERFVVAPLHNPEREQGWRNAQFIAIPDRRPDRWLAES